MSPPILRQKRSPSNPGNYITYTPLPQPSSLRSKSMNMFPRVPPLPTPPNRSLRYLRMCDYYCEEAKYRIFGENVRVNAPLPA